MFNTYKKSLLSSVIIIVLIIGSGWYIWHKHQGSWDSYHESRYGFDLQYPHNWIVVDGLKAGKGDCCLFVVEQSISTTTAANASGTPITTVTAKELIKMQIGHYDTSAYNPFDIASTTPLKLGSNQVYTGTSYGIPFYLIPHSTHDGLGIAIFTSSGKYLPNDQKAVEEILSTVRYTGNSMATSTIGTSTPSGIASTTSKS